LSINHKDLYIKSYYRSSELLSTIWRYKFDDTHNILSDFKLVRLQSDHGSFDAFLKAVNVMQYLLQDLSNVELFNDYW